MNTLFVILGPTGVGKTYLSIDIAKWLGTSIVSCDSRQIYKELKIGVASPSNEQLSEVKHYFIATRSVEEHYSAGQYELDAIPVIEQEIAQNGSVVMVGGSMLYIDAVCRGIDNIPHIDEELRLNVRRIYDEKGIDEVRRLLRLLDPKHYAEVDLKNVKRMLHALEVCYQTGRPFSELRTNNVKKRNFEIVKIGLNLERDTLYNNINRRVIMMIEQGLEQEARSVSDKCHLNALNTVGYKEMFAYFDGEYSLDRAVELIQRNTRHYAKKQLSWFNRYESTHWFSPNDREKVLGFVAKRIKPKL
ncbi:tRNA delta(2)-isopentenylpyrophosphate transferase [Porphyromonadaceae bacterium COT-184 OH4590]|nr:tRNA delta(2)-isopentenylpyrophosphate transferase [Porphyromonadaceae bacterium COT-184 OH4590]